MRTPLRPSLRALLLLPLTLALVVPLTGCGGNFSFFSPEGRVQGRVDPHSGALRVDTPQGQFSGRVDPRGGGFQMTGPGGMMRIDAGPGGGRVVARGPGGSLDLRLDQSQLAAGARLAQLRPPALPRLPPPPPPPPPAAKLPLPLVEAPGTSTALAGTAALPAPELVAMNLPGYDGLISY